MNNLTNFGPSMRFFKMFGRRHHLSGGHFLFRLPLIILWTLIVILILYKSIKSTYPYNDNHVPNTINTKLLPEQLAVRGTSPTVGQEDQYQTDNDAERTTDSSSTRRDANGDGHTSPPPSSANEPVVVAAGIESRAASHLNEAAAAAHQSLVGSLTTTRRSPVSDYMRRNEIFILLVQDDDPISKAYKLNTVSMNMNNGNMYPNSASRLSPTKSPNTSTHKLAVSVHIRQLIDILNYHRIDYTLDVMRTTGLPTELLQNPKKYSVIVIDDFLKYDRLNRWARDQLDRYCRYNRIGVITYLIDSGRLNYHQGDDTASNIPGTPPKGSVPLESAQMPSSSDTIGSGQMMKLTTKQYPMSFEFFNLNCRNLTSANCLVDYQLNDKAQLLRILKRKPNFILRGDLTTNLGVRSLMTMTSNHATHEPLTWARLRRPQVPLLRHQLNKRYATNGAELLANSTQAADYDTLASVVRVRKRAVLPSPTLATPGYYSDDPSGDREQNTSDGVGAGGPRWSSSDEYLDDTRMGRENYAEDLPHGGESELLSSNDQQGGGGGDLSGEEEGQDSADETEDAPGGRKVIAMLDNGLYDDIRRVIFGLSNQHWLNRLLLLDAIEHLSYGEILTPLERYIQIDIDDIFVGATGTRLNKSDVVALIETQKYFATLMEGGEFKFNLGFSGHYFGRGSEAEQLGDRELIANSNKFTWFCHFWSHSKAHLFNTTEALSMELKRNLKFAQDNRLTLIGHRGPPSNYDLEHQNHRRLDNQQPLLPPTYAVAPHHSGVYPIHAPLYEAWRSILNVQITTTEEYPHLRPANQRRGFVHETIKVLPRQTCGLYTHTIFKSRYPGGFKKLIASIRGGELFETIVHNPINIYMTHMSNYGNDRLAPFTFKALFEFVKEYTNLRLKYSPIIKADTDDDDKDDDASQRHQVEDSTKQTVTGGPMFLADLYFSLHPEEREPLWTNPCDDKRHLAIWSLRKLELCHIVPKLLIVGPQKTGTTALQSFLKLNPSIGTSSMSSEDFEEVQFFNDKHYLKGTDWYFERFITQRDGKQRNISSGTNTTTTTNPSIFLDKSATYFDDPKAPRRASSLLPDAYIVILLINPADRAYSWYQHMKAHGDPIASEFSFDEVIMFQETTTSDKMTTTTTTRTASPALIRSNGTSTTTTSTSSSSSSSNGLGGRSLTEHQIVAMRALRNRCLHPGYYSNHLLRWLNYYQSRQIVIIDGEWFKFNPKAVLNRLQLLLNLPEQVDYDKLLVYQRSKGFYCERKGGGGGGDDDDDATDLAGDRSSRNVNGSRQTINRGNNNKRNHHHHTAPNIKCLGSGKGRKYASMSANSRAYLDDHYLSHNRQLARLLYEIGQPLPRWLDRSINPLPTTVRLL